eukprot:g1502.t1
MRNIIVCLHGKLQNGDLFSSRLRHVLKKTRNDDVEFVFLDGPVTLPLREGDSVAMRAWYEWNDKSDYTVKNAVQFVIKKIHDIKIRGNCRVRGLMAFSQGSSLLLPILLSKDSAINDVRFVICAGAMLSPNFTNFQSTPYNIPSIHFIGRNDQRVTPERSLKMATCFLNPIICKHPKGHIFPQQATHTNMIRKFILEHIYSKEGQQEGEEQEPKEPEDTCVMKDKEEFSPTIMHLDEIESLTAIYNQDTVRFENKGQHCIIRVQNEESTKTIALRFAFKQQYPGPEEDDNTEDKVGQNDKYYSLSLFPAECSGWQWSSMNTILAKSREHLDQECEKGDCVVFSIISFLNDIVEDLTSKDDSEIERKTAVGDSHQSDGSSDHTNDKMNQSFLSRSTLATSSSKSVSSSSQCSASSNPSSEIVNTNIEDELDSAMIQEITMEAAQIMQLFRKRTVGNISLTNQLRVHNNIRGESLESMSNLSDNVSTIHLPSFDQWSSLLRRDGRMVYGEKFTVGLVGKPSAGKSTFFNAAKDEGTKAARVGAFPFTTIDPNIGAGSVRIPWPRKLLTNEWDIGHSVHTTIGTTTPVTVDNTTPDKVDNTTPHKVDNTTPDKVDNTTPDKVDNNTPHKVDNTTPDKVDTTPAQETDQSYVPFHNMGLILKDVAGLVPGAYLGRGKGNAFLGDLTDADCLIHIVDGSGRSDAKGNIDEAILTGTGSTINIEESSCSSHKSIIKDNVKKGTKTTRKSSKKNEKENITGTTTCTGPLHDVVWIYEELHRWVYTNARRKWSSVVRNPSKRFINLFTGYRCVPSDIHLVLKLSGLLQKNVNTSNMNKNKKKKSKEGRSDTGKETSEVDYSLEDVIQNWGPKELHRFVGFFLRYRFPVFIAFNKADIPGTQENYAKFRTTFPYESSAIMSAQDGRGVIQVLRRSVLLTQPVIVYHLRKQLPSPSSSSAALSGNIAMGHTKQEQNMQNTSEIILDSQSESSYHTTKILPLLCRPGVTAYDIYRYLHSPGMEKAFRLPGDYVRAIRYDLQHGYHNPCKKDLAIRTNQRIICYAEQPSSSDNNCTTNNKNGTIILHSEDQTIFYQVALKIFTNKKVQWQTRKRTTDTKKT